MHLPVPEKHQSAGAGGGAAQWLTPHCTPLCALSPSGRGCRTSKGRCAKFSPFFFLCLGNQGLPSSSQRPHSGLCRCSWVGDGVGEQMAPQPQLAKQRPCLRQIWIRKGLLVSEHWGPILWSPQQRGYGWLKVTRIIQEAWLGWGLTRVYSQKYSEGANRPQLHGASPQPGWGITYNQLPGYRHTPLSL